MKDPVCGMTVDPAAPPGGTAEHAGTTYYFCNPSCRQRFVADPARYLEPRPDLVTIQPQAAPPHRAADSVEYTCPMHPEIVRMGPGTCPICGMALEPRVATGEEPENPELRDMTRRFWVGLALTAPLFVMTMGGMFVPSLATRAWIEMALATPVVLWAGWPFFERMAASIAS